jgi:NAD(P)-dependent dehydrogenase (short-subunit alcohol dehydrogenase family)
LWEDNVSNRLENKVAIVVGAGQTPGDTIGNGRAISVLFARHGAKVMLVDCRSDSADETKYLITGEGGKSFAFQADIVNEEDCRRIAEECVNHWGRIDVLVNVVGIGTGDNSVVKLERAAWENIFDVNLKGMFLTCKHVLPVMKQQESGSIINISSVAAVCATGMTAYPASKAGVNALTHQMAMTQAKYGIRVNAIMPGLMHTPMAIEGISSALGIDKDDLIQLRNQAVPLQGGMGDGWDTAYAALFLASDEAKFITGIVLPVDGGQSAKIG